MSLPSLSVLNLSPIVEGGSAAEALRNSLDLAQHAERLGYRRYLAEHHNLDGVASSATAALAGHIAGGTKTIRVGSGDVMLPNHAPLVIAEQFGTLATLYPGRIDLGLGRAPGTDRLTMRALRRHLDARDEEEGFPRDAMELQSYLGEPSAENAVRAIPGVDTQVPIWLLGASVYSAQLAAHLSLPFAAAAVRCRGRSIRRSWRHSGHCRKRPACSACLPRRRWGQRNPCGDSSNRLSSRLRLKS